MPTRARDQGWKELDTNLIHSLVRKFIPMPQWKNNGKIGKNPAWHLAEVRNKKDVINEARNKVRKVHFASLMDLCHFKNSELEPQNQNTKEASYSEVTL